MRREAHCDPKFIVELVEGRADATSREGIEAHAAGCEHCGATLSRLRNARNAFRIARADEPPENIAYERIGAQIAWRIGRELEAQSKRSRRRLFLVSGAAFALIGGGAVALFFLRAGSKADPKAPIAVPGPVTPTPGPVTPDAVKAAGQLAAVPTLVEGSVSIGTGLELAPLLPEAFAQAALQKGGRIETRVGRAAFALDAGTGLLVGPGSSLSFTSLDQRVVEISLDEGQVVFEVKARGAEQIFRVRAGDRTVTVRGTRFLVERRRRTLRVAVSHGKVEIGADGSAGTLAVDAGIVAELGEQDQPSAARVRALEEGEKSELDEGLLLAPEGAGFIRIMSAPSATISLDGAMLGRHMLTARTAAGRHLVEASLPGETMVSRWVDVKTGETAQVKVAAEKTARKPTEKQRPMAIDELVRSASKEIRRCYDAGVAKNPDLEGSVLLRFDVDASGTLAPVEVSSSTLKDPAVEDCLKAVVQKWKFPPGAPSTVIYPIELHRN